MPSGLYPLPSPKPSAARKDYAAALSLDSSAHLLSIRACSIARLGRYSARNRTAGSASQWRPLLYVGRSWTSIELLCPRIYPDPGGMLARPVGRKQKLIVQEPGLWVHTTLRKCFLVSRHACLRLRLGFEQINSMTSSDFDPK